MPLESLCAICAFLWLSSEVRRYSKLLVFNLMRLLNVLEIVLFWLRIGTREVKTMSAAEGFAYCERLAHAHYENFPVGSLLIPKSKRPHFYSIYAFARTADDFADEGYDRGLSDADRLAALDDWGEQLEHCERWGEQWGEEGRASSPVFVALAATIRDLDLPLQLFRDLISAFKQDVIKRRYASYDEVLDYCTRSANPVGRLILLLFGYRDPRLHILSDHICTALQLANHWQDVAVDIREGSNLSAAGGPPAIRVLGG